MWIISNTSISKSVKYNTSLVIQHLAIIWSVFRENFLLEVKLNQNLMTVPIFYLVYSVLNYLLSFFFFPDLFFSREEFLCEDSSLCNKNKVKVRISEFFCHLWRSVWCQHTSTPDTCQPTQSGNHTSIFLFRQTEHHSVAFGLCWISLSLLIWTAGNCSFSEEALG